MDFNNKTKVLTVIVGLAVLSMVLTPIFVTAQLNTYDESNAGDTGTSGQGLLTGESPDANEEPVMPGLSTDDSVDESATGDAGEAETADTGETSTSTIISPNEDSKIEVTFEGQGLQADDLNIDSHMNGQLVRVTLEGTISSMDAEEGEGDTTIPGSPAIPETGGEEESTSTDATEPDVLGSPSDSLGTTTPEEESAAPGEEAATPSPEPFGAPTLGEETTESETPEGGLTPEPFGTPTEEPFGSEAETGTESNSTSGGLDSELDASSGTSTLQQLITGEPAEDTTGDTGSVEASGPDMTQESDDTSIAPSAPELPSSGLSDELGLGSTTEDTEDTDGAAATSEAEDEIDEPSDAPDAFENSVSFVVDGGEATITISGEGVTPTGLSLNQQMIEDDKFHISVEATFTLDGSLLSTTAGPEVGPEGEVIITPGVPGQSATELPEPPASEDVAAPSTTLTVAPTGAAAGDQITIIGDGFAPNDSIEVTYDDQTLDTTEPVTADADGSFTATATVPEDVNGTFNMITAEDQSGNSAHAMFIKTDTSSATPSEEPFGAPAPEEETEPAPGEETTESETPEGGLTPEPFGTTTPEEGTTTSPDEGEESSSTEESSPFGSETDTGTTTEETPIFPEAGAGDETSESTTDETGGTESEPSYNDGIIGP